MTAEKTSRDALFLLADSRLLFDERFTTRIARALRKEARHATAAYLGASNGDVPEFFEIFSAAMDRMGVGTRMHVHAEPSRAEMAFLASADLVVLAGGDVARGWKAFERAGLVESLRTRHAASAVLVGVSAGAVHLGTAAAFDPEVPLLSFVPHAISVHEEPEWADGVALVESSEGRHVVLGIPLGGAAIVHDDRSVEAYGKPITEISWTPTGARRAAIVPQTD